MTTEAKGGGSAPVVAKGGEGRGRRSRLILALLGVSGLALALRLIAGVDYPFHPDAAYFALKAEQVYYVGRMFDPRHVPTYAPVWPYLIAYTAGGLDALAQTFRLPTSGLTLSDVYLPPVAGAALGLSTVVLGRVLYDWKMGIFAGFGVAVSPLAIADSARGATDHDAFSLSLIVLTTAALVACYPKSPDGGGGEEPVRRRWRLRSPVLWLVPGALFTVALLTWKGAIAITLFLAVIVLADLIGWRRKRTGMHPQEQAGGDVNDSAREKKETKKLLPLIAYVGLFFLIPTVVGYATGIAQTYNVTLSAVDIFGAIAHYFLAFLAGLHLLPRGSLSLLFPTVGEYQSQSWPIVVFFLGIFNVLAPLAVAPFLERPSRKDVTAMVLFVVTFAAAFRSTDLTFMAIPFVSLASARFLSWLLEKSAPLYPTRWSSSKRRTRIERERTTNNNKRFYLAVTLLALGPAGLGLTMAVQYARNPQNLPIMPSYWFGPLEWMKENTCNTSLIFTWWDYGYYVTYWGRRLPVMDNSYQPDVRAVDVAKTLIGSDPGVARSIIAKYLSEDNMSQGYYLVTSDELALMPIIHYAATYNLTTGESAGVSPVPWSLLYNSLYYKLFYSNMTVGQEPIPGFQLAYKNPEVRIYKVVSSSSLPAACGSYTNSVV